MNNTQFKKIVGEILKSQGFAYENKYYTKILQNTDMSLKIELPDGYEESEFSLSF